MPKTVQWARKPLALPQGPHPLAVLRVLHPFPSLLVSALTVALAVFADRHANAGIYVQLGLGMLFFQFAIGLTNDVVDLESDAATKPWKPIARGAISRQRAVLGAAACAGLGLLITSTLPLGAWLIGAAGLFCGLSYDVYFKRTPLSWLPYAVAMPLIPVWVYSALELWDALLWWVIPLGAVFGLALHLANQAPDIPAERGRRTVGAAHRLGLRRSLMVSLALFGIAASIAVAVLLFVSPGRALLGAIDTMFAALLAPRATAYFGRDGLFGLLSASAAVLAVVFLSAV